MPSLATTPPSADGPSPFTRRAVLALLLAGGAALRAFHLDWGLPQFVFFDSLAHFVRPAARILATGDWSPVSFVHPPATTYLLAAVAAVWAETSGSTPSHGDLELVGRVLMVVLSTATIAVLYLLARRLVDDRAALIGTAAFALAPLHVLEAHRTHADAGMLLVSLVAAHQAVLARDTRSRGRLYLAFALAGCAGGVKYPGLASASVPAWVALTWHGRSFRERIVFSFAGSAVTVVAFLVAISPLLLAWPRLWATVKTIAYAGLFVGQPGQNLVGAGWVYQRYLYPLAVAIPYMTGWPIYLAGLVGLGLLTVSRRARGPVLAAVLPFFVFEGGATTAVPRYFLPLAPYLCLAAGHALDQLVRRQRRLGAVATALVLGYTLVLTQSQLLRIGASDALAVTNRLRTASAAARAAGRELVVAYPQRLRFAYDPLSPALVQARVRIVTYPKIPAAVRRAGPHAVLQRYREWLARESVDAVLVTSHIEGVAERNRARPEVVLLAALEDGNLGYRRAAEARTHFFTESLYTWADPTLSTHLTAGILGHKLFVR